VSFLSAQFRANVAVMVKRDFPTAKIARPSDGVWPQILISGQRGGQKVLSLWK
jgi:hypothetical protein